jgi:hypothetical protein
MSRHSEKMKSLWADPEWRARVLHARGNHSAYITRMWQDPDFRHKAMTNRKSVQELQVKLDEGAATCIRCNTKKSLSDFPHSRKKRSGLPRYAYCKVCHGEYQRELRYRNLFNITVDEYDKVLQFQDGKCAICCQPPKRLRLAVDHDHKTGLIRGLLCPWCNRAIGQFRDDMSRVRRVVDYFEKPPFSQVLGQPRFGLKGRVSNKAATRRRLNKQ